VISATVRTNGVERHPDDRVMQVHPVVDQLYHYVGGGEQRGWRAWLTVMLAAHAVVEMGGHPGTGRQREPGLAVGGVGMPDRNH
jgi:hypothetical protein